jgi:hypothetical protein
MFAKRALAALGTAALVAFGMVGLATPAQAGGGTTWDVAIDCTGPVYLPGSPGDHYNIYLVGDCLTTYAGVWNAIDDPVSNSPMLSDMGFFGWPDYGANWNEYTADCIAHCSGLIGDWFVVANQSPGVLYDVPLLGANEEGGVLVRGGAVATIAYGNPGDPTHQYIYLGTGAGPTEYWHQSVGRASVDATCATGWSASWEQWMNDGKGGWVCTRDVVMYG